MWEDLPLLYSIKVRSFNTSMNVKRRLSCAGTSSLVERPGVIVIYMMKPEGMDVN